MTAPEVFSQRSSYNVPDGASGSPNGDRAEDLEDLVYLSFSDPFELGKAIAAVANCMGEAPGTEQILDLVRTHFDHEDERTVFAGFHRYWNRIPF